MPLWVAGASLAGRHRGLEEASSRASSAICPWMASQEGDGVKDPSASSACPRLLRGFSAHGGLSHAPTGGQGSPPGWPWSGQWPAEAVEPCLLGTLPSTVQNAAILWATSHLALSWASSTHWALLPPSCSTASEDARVQGPQLAVDPCSRGWDVVSRGEVPDTALGGHP